jgi:hypothetical protein
MFRGSTVRAVTRNRRQCPSAVIRRQWLMPPPDGITAVTAASLQQYCSVSLPHEAVKTSSAESVLRTSILHNGFWLNFILKSLVQLQNTWGFNMDAAPDNLVETDGNFRRPYCVQNLGDGPDGGNNKVWNVGRFLLDYKAQHSRRQSH